MFASEGLGVGQILGPDPEKQVIGFSMNGDGNERCDEALEERRLKVIHRIELARNHDPIPPITASIQEHRPPRGGATHDTSMERASSLPGLLTLRGLEKRTTLRVRDRLSDQARTMAGPGTSIVGTLSRP